jgi:oligopeptide transport system permease protein
MNDKPPDLINQPDERELIHLPPEFVVAEGDIHVLGDDDYVAGTSLWKDAWRRLLRNRLAVFGLIIVTIVAITSIIGPSIIKAATGYTYDFIPRDVLLIKSIPPFRAANGSFSWAHPMGTDNSGRDVLARVLLGGRISGRAC